METFSVLLAICAGTSPVTGEFLIQRLVTRSFDVFFDRGAVDLRRHRAHYDVIVMNQDMGFWSYFLSSIIYYFRSTTYWGDCRWNVCRVTEFSYGNYYICQVCIYKNSEP